MPDINLDNIELITYVSRYVVPFYFSYENNGYEEITEFFEKNKQSNSSHILPKGKWMECGIGERYKSGDTASHEMDIYTYLLNVYKKDDNDSNIGTSFVYKIYDEEVSSGDDDKKDNTDNKKNNIKEPKFFSYIDANSLEISCTELGVILYKTGVGFLWYELSFEHAYGNTDNSDSSLQKFINCQHRFRELSKTTGYFISEENTEGKIKKSNKLMLLGEWVKEVISADEAKIQFWGERTVNGKNNKVTTVPDAALLFQYAFIGDSTDDTALRNNVAFWLGNGFDQKFNPPHDFSNLTYSPFGNASFYICKGGMSYVVSYNNTDYKFFSETFPHKFRDNYFFIYMLLIYQSYSCSQYSRLLSKKLPANKDKYLKDDNYAELLGDLDYQIQIFLVKSIYESVSSIQHQNGVYKYGENMLRINEEIASLELGLSSLRELITQKQDAIKAEEERIEKEIKESKETATNYALYFFGLLAFFSVMTDSLSTVDRIMKLDGQDPLNWAHYSAIFIIVVLGAFTLVRLVKYHPKRKRKKK